MIHSPIYEDVHIDSKTLHLALIFAKNAFTFLVPIAVIETMLVNTEHLGTKTGFYHADTSRRFNYQI